MLYPARRQQTKLPALLTMACYTDGAAHSPNGTPYNENYSNEWNDVVTHLGPCPLKLAPTFYEMPFSPNEWDDVVMHQCRYGLQARGEGGLQ